MHKLLGGAYRNQVQPNATGFYRQEGLAYPEVAEAEARRHLARGFTAMKLMVDANHAYNMGNARRLLRALEPAQIHWFEEPISPEDIDGYRELKNLTSIQPAAGENEFTKFGFREWVLRRAVDILQPDLCAAGCLTECRKISALAQAWHLPIVLHVWGSGIALAASLQFIATLPPAPLALQPVEPMLECDQSDHPFRGAPIHDAIGPQDGLVRIPDGPGLGVDINREVLARYASA